MKKIGVAILLALQLAAQKAVVRQGSSPAGDVDFSSAKSTKPARTGATLPNACVANELFLLTNVGLQQRVKGKLSPVRSGGTWGTVGGAPAAQTGLWNMLQSKQPQLNGSPSQDVRGDGSLGSLAGVYEPVDPSIVRGGSSYINPAWVSFSISGAGAVNRTVSSKLNDTISVKDYGAAGNGIADDTAAIQAARNAVCTAGGGDLLYPVGTYLVSLCPGANAGTFKICTNMHVVLAGGATVRVKPNAEDYFSLYLPAALSTQVDNFTMDGPGTIDQNAASNTTSTIAAGSTTAAQQVVAIYAGSNFKLRGLRIYASGVNTIVANGSGVNGASVLHNHLTFQKRAGQAAFDNSAIYIGAANFLVSDDIIEGYVFDSSATPVKAHTGSATVSNNSFSLYRTGIVLLDAHSAASGETFGNIFVPV